MKIGDFRTRRKVTGKFFLAAEATPDQYRNYGNQKLTKQEPKVDRAQQLTSDKGSNRVTHEEPSQIELRHTIKVDEHHTDLVGLLHLSGPPQTVNQGADNAAAWNVNNVQQGYDYYIGAMGLTAFTVTGKVEGNDYTINLGTGMLHIIEGGGIANNSNIAGTRTAPALVFSKYTSLSKLFFRGHARLLTTDGNSDVPREVVEGDVELYVSDWGDNDGTKWNEVTIMILWTSIPTVTVIELS